MSQPQDGTAPELLFALLPDSGIAPDGPDTLAPLAHALTAQYPRALVLHLHPPLRDAEGRCRWWASDHPEPDGVNAAVPQLIERLRFEAARHELPWQRVAVAGVGDGALLALEAVQAEPALVGRVLAFAGGYLARPEAAPQDVCVHLLHGLGRAHAQGRLQRGDEGRRGCNPYRPKARRARPPALRPALPAQGAVP